MAVVAVVAVVACAGDEPAAHRPPEVSPPGDGPALVDGEHVVEGDGPPGRCDPASLAARGSLAGCRFVMIATPAGGCHAVVVSNPSSRPARLRLRFKGNVPDVRDEDAAPYARRVLVEGDEVRYEPLEGGTIGPRESAVVSALLVPSAWEDPSAPIRCPTAAFVESDEPVAHERIVTPGIELRSDEPVVAAQVFGFARSARQRSVQQSVALIPVHLWEKSPAETGIFKPGLPAALPFVGEEGEPLEITTWPARTFAVAAFDDTNVTLPHPDGMLGEGTLQRGEVFSHTTGDALTGRRAIADKPVALVTSSGGAVIPWDYDSEGLGYDSGPVYSMALPSTAWGSEYVAVRHGDRWSGAPEEAVWRVVGGADDTELAYEPYRPAGAPARIARGELAVFFADAAFVVKSQDDAHGFYLSESMTGSAYQRVRSGLLDRREPHRGAPVTVHQLARARYATRYAFFAPPGFPELSLVLVRPRDAKGAVRLDCAGALEDWEPVGDRYELRRVTFTEGVYASVDHPGGACRAGAHWIEGDDVFWGTLWGWGNGLNLEGLEWGTSGAFALPLFGAGREPDGAQQ